MTVTGVLTLENVIERILQVDIYDERDRENAMAVLTRTQSYHPPHLAGNGPVMSPRLQKQPSYRYRFKHAESELLTSNDTNENGVFTSKFVMDFATSLKATIRDDIKRKQSYFTN